MSAPAAPHPSSAGSSWSALRTRDFRWMVFAQAISYTGSWMQLAAINWHVYELTRDPAALGLVGLVRIIPIIVLSLFGGVLADAFDRRRLMIITSSAMGCVAFVLALVTFSGQITIGLLYLFTAVLAGLSAFDKPAWAGLLPNLVPKEQIANAVRLNVVVVQLTLVIGPVIAGILLARIGAGGAYLFNALSYLPVVIVLLAIHARPVVERTHVPFRLSAVADGIRFLRRTPMLWSTMLLDFFATFFGSALALLPIYATEILHVGAEGYGVLYAAPAVGATIGAISMAQIGGRMRRQGEVMLIAVAIYGAATVVFGLSSVFWLSLLALAVVGLSDSISTVIRNALRQLLTPDHLRGRMLSINQIFFLGGPQLGEFEAGVAASVFSAPFAVISGGIGAVLVTGLVWARVPLLRHYDERATLAAIEADADAPADGAPLTQPAPAAGD